MLNQRRNHMTDDEPEHLNAVVDTVRFASRDNPITESNFVLVEAGVSRTV